MNKEIKFSFYNQISVVSSEGRGYNLLEKDRGPMENGALA